MTGRTILAGVFLAAAVASTVAETVGEVEFRDRPLTDILLALGELYGRSILADDTVSGVASCYLREQELEGALASLLPAHGLYSWEEGDIVRVSRIRLEASPSQGGFDVDAERVDVETLIRRFSEASRTAILSGALRGRTISIHAKGLTPRALMDIVQQRFPDVLVEWTGAACFVRESEPGSAATAARRERAEAARAITVAPQGCFTLRAVELSFRNAVGALARAAGRQVLFLSGPDTILHDLHIDAKPFEVTLDLLLKLAGCGCTRAGDTYIVYDVDDRDVLRQLDETVVVPLLHIRAELIPALLPPHLASTNRLRVEPASNSVVLVGKPAEREPLERFLRALDHPPLNRTYFRFDLSYLDIQDFLRLLPAEFASAVPLVVPGRQSFILPLTGEQRARLADYIAAVDRPLQSETIQLRNLSVKELLENLPPGVTPEEIRTTSDPSTFFFIGDRSRRNVLEKRLAVLDRPKPQIRYELLVIQHRRGENENREVALTSSMLTGGERNAFLGSIGKLLSLRFDIVSAFGYLFAVNLNADLASARARILADTTLNGISGQKITFRNTDTYRYRDALVNPDTGHLDPTGVVREITSGLIIGIDGWVSGANVITMNISSTVSARGTDTSGTTNALPSTTEKLITTHVRTRSGIPVVIGGLLERTTETRIDKVPLLGDIPLIGRLFRKRVTSSQDSELAVYILPHVERGPRESQPLSSRLEAIYERLVGGEQDG